MQPGKLTDKDKAQIDLLLGWHTKRPPSERPMEKPPKNMSKEDMIKLLLKAKGDG